MRMIMCMKDLCTLGSACFWASNRSLCTSHLNHGRISVLLDISDNLYGYIRSMFPVPALQDSAKCAYSTVLSEKELYDISVYIWNAEAAPSPILLRILSAAQKMATQFKTALTAAQLQLRNAVS